MTNLYNCTIYIGIKRRVIAKAPITEPTVIDTMKIIAIAKIPFKLQNFTTGKNITNIEHPTAIIGQINKISGIIIKNNNLKSIL